jgi:hypothetical protein
MRLDADGGPAEPIGQAAVGVSGGMASPKIVAAKMASANALIVIPAKAGTQL